MLSARSLHMLLNGLSLFTSVLRAYRHRDAQFHQPSQPTSTAINSGLLPTCNQSLQVKQYETAVKFITSGDPDGARAILQQLLHDPLLQQQAVAAGEITAVCSSSSTGAQGSSTGV